MRMRQTVVDASAAAESKRRLEGRVHPQTLAAGLREAWPCLDFLYLHCTML